MAFKCREFPGRKFSCLKELAALLRLQENMKQGKLKLQVKARVTSNLEVYPSAEKTPCT